MSARRTAQVRRGTLPAGIALALALWAPAAAWAAGSVNATGTCPGVTVSQGDNSVGCQADTTAPANTLNDFGNKYNRHWHEYAAETLTNRTGGGVVAGDVVALSTANDSSVVAADTAISRRPFVVAMATIADTVVGEFARAGAALTKCTGTINRGEYVRKSATAKAVESTAVLQATDATRPDGTLGLALTTCSGGFVTAYLYGATTTLDAVVAGTGTSVTPGTRQNVIAQTATATGNFNYLFNSNMSIWGSGPAAAPTGWTLSAGGSVAQNTTAGQYKYGTSSAALTRTSGTLTLGQNVVLIYPPLASWQSTTVSAGCWVRATVASRARVQIFDGVAAAFSSYHTGGSAFEFLTVSLAVNVAATDVTMFVQVDTGNTTAQFDGCVLVRGASVPSDWVESGWRGRKSVFQLSGAGGGLTANPSYYGSGSGSTTEANVLMAVPFKSVARNLRARETTGASTTVETLRIGAGDSTVTCTMVAGTCSDTTHEAEIGAGGLIAMKSTEAGSRVHIAVIELEEIP